MSLTAEHALHLLVTDALSLVDPASSDALIARRVVGYVQRHAHRLDGLPGVLFVTLRGRALVFPQDLAGLTATVSRPAPGDLRVALDFSATRLRGLL